MKSIYIAGPMSGRPFLNFPAFDAASSRLSKLGWNPVSPADLDREAGFSDPDEGIEYPVITKEFLRQAVARDLAAMQRVDAVYMLSGWKESKGAKAEHQIALWRGIEIHYEDEELPATQTLSTSGEDPKRAAGSTKCPLWLLPPGPMTETAWVHKLGADKYGAWNWRDTGVNASTYISAIMRHLCAWAEGEDLDPESGRSHLAHIAACCNIVQDAASQGKLRDDRAIHSSVSAP